ncbi:MAG: VWA domain-containing protein [Kofleriaceae bacterium]
MSTRTLSTLFGALLIGCGSGSTRLLGPCEVDPPDPACGLECEPPPAANTCPFGFHCNLVSECDAACTQGGDECGAGQRCSSDGFCELIGGPDADRGPDADCPSIDFMATQTIPTVQLLVDRSGSMLSSIGGGSSTTRWDAVKSALLDPADGVVTNLQSQVVFGLSVYTNTNTGTGMAGVCPAVDSTATRALNNLGPITQVMDDTPPIAPNQGGTPTGPSIDAIVADFAATPPADGSPPIIVLATDGQPFICPNNDDGDLGQVQAIEAAQRAYEAGIRLFILAVGNGLNASHQQKVANAGVGLDPDTGTAPYYRADSPAELTSAFGSIINGVQSCELDIDGQIDPALASQGTVTLNGGTLVYGSDWQAVDGDTIELIGAACEILKGQPNPTVTANFPCNVVIID